MKTAGILPILLFVLVTSHLLLPSSLHAQAENSEEDGDQQATEIGDEPLPYDPEEFPAWSRDLRRGEIVALGSFPITMILSGFTYQLGRFAYQSALAGQATTEYAPWFFSTSTEPRYTNDERIGLIISAATLSVGVAVLDYLLGRRERREE